MAGKRSKHVRRFMAAGATRLEEAEVLRKVALSTGAVYLAGYAVECTLKALILALVDEHEQPAELARFRGRVGHDFEWLKARYREFGGAGFPKPVGAAFLVVADWSTDLRYNPRRTYGESTDSFFAAVSAIRDWAEERV